MFYKNYITIVITFLVISSCAIINTKYNSNLVKKSVKGSQLFSNHFIGFVLYDPETRKYLYELNADKYFTPASNTKLFTFYAGLKILKDSIPALKYYETEDSLVIYGTGDPTFLHPNFKSQKVFNFLKASDKNIYVMMGNFQDPPFGPGWAWNDYEYYYQPERSGFPIYGNVISFVKDSLSFGFQLEPKFFKDYTEILKSKQKLVSNSRLIDYNIFSFFPDITRSNSKNRIPFKTSDELLIKLLSDTLNKQVSRIYFKPRPTRTLYSRSAQEIYALMLKASDNFIAEQIHYLCAAQLDYTFQSSLIRNYITEKYLTDLPSKPIWRDGSGLSRYNLFTPRSIVVLLEKLKQEVSEENLLALLSIGGIDGTIKNWYVPEESKNPFIFAKTGTLSNNHSLSGFIRTKSGKLLTFSFMHNNYNISSFLIKEEMDKVLRLVRDKY